ncbi:MAG: DUF72 domain-containing protein [Planctomycetota bacterium]
MPDTADKTGQHVVSGNASPSTPYRLGCPVWACADWVGELYSTTNRRRWLGEYSRVFGTVEVNGSFYAMPELDTVKRWADEAGGGFRFVLKFPASITHERQLVGAGWLTDQFLAVLGLLQAADRLGPALLQLPPFFAGSQFPALERYLRDLPNGLPVAVEVRHADYFDGAANESALDGLLAELGHDRALFDSRPLFSAPPSDDIERASQSRKPRSPFRTTAVGRSPMVRLVGRNDLSLINPWIDEWAGVVGRWIAEGRTPYFFTHAPDDRLAPRMAERFHTALAARVGRLGGLPAWPGRVAERQRELF